MEIILGIWHFIGLFYQ